MVVSGMKTGMSYVLGKKYVRKESDGVIYNVPQMPHTMIKIINKDQRTTRERSVIDAVNGVGSILGPEPLEPVYEHGRFVGYAFQEDLYDEDPVMPPEPPKPQSSGNWGINFLVCACVGAAASLWLFYFGFQAISAGFSPEMQFFNFRGIPMILVGWAAMIAILLYMKKEGAEHVVTACVAGILAFALGSALTCGAICLLVLLVETAYSVAMALLPTVVFILILVYLVKYLLRGGR